MALKIKRGTEQVPADEQVEQDIDDGAALALLDEPEGEVAETTEVDPAEDIEVDEDADEDSEDLDDDDDDEHDEPESAASEPVTAGEVVTKIAEAEQKCKAAESRVNILRENLKEAKKEYDGNVVILRKLCAALVKDEDRPLFNQKPAASTPVTAQTAGPAPAAETPTVDPDAWRSEPLTNISFGEIKGFGAKKQEALHAKCPTVGDFEDLRGGKGIASIKGISDDMAAEIVDRVLDHLSKTRDAATIAAAAGTTSTDAEPTAPATTSSVPVAPAPESVTYLTSKEWDKLSDEKQAEHLKKIAERLTAGESDYLLDSLTSQLENKSFWASGQESHGKGLELTDCGILPGPEQDDWLRGWLYAENMADEAAEEIDAASEESETEEQPTKPEPVNLDDL